MSLTIRSSFSMDAPLSAAWALLTDVERAAPCFPGTQLLGQNEDGSWKANFVVKLGPMAFIFEGRFQIAEADVETKHVVVKAQGSDKKGRGGANATVDVHLSSEAGCTVAHVVSIVDLSGSVAQFGRGAGMIEALSRQLIQQFATNLQQALPKHAEPAVGEVAPPALAAAPHQSLNAGTLFLRAMVAPLKAWIRRLFGRGAVRATNDGSAP